MKRARDMRRRLARFAAGEAGNYTIETVLVLPLLVWACLATLTFTDAYRAQLSTLRISYAIADMLSRWQEKEGIGPEHIDGLGRVFEYLAEGSDNTYLRVTSLVYDAEDDRHEIVFSRGTRADPARPAPPPITAATLAPVVDRLPILADRDSVILLESWLDYTPPFRVGLGSRRFETDLVVSPRFIPRLTYDPDN